MSRIAAAGGTLARCAVRSDPFFAGGVLEWILSAEHIKKGVLEPAPLALQPANRPAAFAQHLADLFAQVLVLFRVHLDGAQAVLTRHRMDADNASDSLECGGDL